MRLLRLRIGRGMEMRGAMVERVLMERRVAVNTVDGSGKGKVNEFQEIVTGGELLLERF